MRTSERLTIGSNRSLRSLGRAKARPLTKRYGFQKMSQNLHNLKQWIENNRVKLIGYDVHSIGHEALDSASIIGQIISGIYSGKLSAIELGADFVIADFRSPFGRILKCKIYNGLRRQVGYIDPERKSKLISLAINGIDLPYPPRELKALIKLIKKFGRSACESVIDAASPKTIVGKKHISNLGGRP